MTEKLTKASISLGALVLTGIGLSIGFRLGNSASDYVASHAHKLKKLNPFDKTEDQNSPQQEWVNPDPANFVPSTSAETSDMNDALKEAFEQGKRLVTKKSEPEKQE